MVQGLHQFSGFGEIAENLFFKGVLGQSSLPICVLGTIEFIWAGWIPLKPHHKTIPPQNHVFLNHFSPQKGPRAKMSPPNLPEADLGNFSKSLRKMRTANPSEMLSRTPPSTFQTEPLGLKTLFLHFSCKNAKMWDHHVGCNNAKMWSG